VRALILKIPPELRNPKKNPRKAWSADVTRHRELVGRLEEAEKQQDFYTGLYRQYTADLLKMALYIRKVITTPQIPRSSRPPPRIPPERPNRNRHGVAHRP
jgi:hypothetical protein